MHIEESVICASLSLSAISQVVISDRLPLSAGVCGCSTDIRADHKTAGLISVRLTEWTEQRMNESGRARWDNGLGMNVHKRVETLWTGILTSNIDTHTPTHTHTHMHTHVGDWETTMYANSSEPPCPPGAALQRVIFGDRLWAG